MKLDCQSPLKIEPWLTVNSDKLWGGEFKYDPVDFWS
jgi:hypothetical protein